MGSRAVWSLLAACLVLTAAPDAEQDPRRQTFRVGAEMVVVDLVATDRNGGFIRDLQPSDIQLTEDGKPRKIEFLRLVRNVGRTAAADARGLPAIGNPSTPAASAAAPSKPEGALVILIDIGSMPIEVLPRVRTAIHGC